MKNVLPILALVAVLDAFGAFSSEKWLAERGDDSDVLRLRDAYAACLTRRDPPAENVMLPIETFPDGKVKSRITAQRASVFADTGFVWGKNIRVEQYKPDGSLQATLTADDCLVDRKTRTGWVEGQARMTFGATSVRGRGIYFALDREFIKIFSQSEIRAPHGGFDPRSLTK